MSKNKRYYWLKLKKDFFTDKTIKKLRKIAGGDTYTIIYLKLLLKSTETGGKLYFDGIEDTFAEEIALDIDEDTENVKVTLMYLLKCGLLVEVSSNEIELTRINELVGSETNKAELMRKKRSRDKQIESKGVTMLPDVTQTLPDVTETLPYIEKEKDIDIELDIEKEKEKEKNKQKRKKKYSNSSELSSSSSSQIDLVINSYHEICASLTKVRSVTDDRKRAIKTLLTKMSIEEIREAFTKAEDTPFLKGENDRGWKANIDFMLKHAHLVKILEGFYDSNSKGKSDTYGATYNIDEFEKYSIFDDNEDNNKNTTNTDWWNKTI